MKTIANIILTPGEISINGNCEKSKTDKDVTLHDIYRSRINDYPRFFKMDGLCKLGIVATELLLSSTGEERFIQRDDRAVILFGRRGSSSADHSYQETIENPMKYYPSPALFVFTLPNIVTGEIAIRNKYLGETSFFLLDSYDEKIMNQVVQQSFMDTKTKSVLTGWVDFTSDVDYVAKLSIIEKEIE